METGKHLEAFSIQLVILAIWKQALHICHAEAASAMEGSPSPVTARFRRSCDKKHCSPSFEVCTEAYNTLGPEEVSAHIEGEFLGEVQHAEELAKVIEPGLSSLYFLLIWIISLFYCCFTASFLLHGTVKFYADYSICVLIIK